jgi:hypothetical protein
VTSQNPDINNLPQAMLLHELYEVRTKAIQIKVAQEPNQTTVSEINTFDTPTDRDSAITDLRILSNISVTFAIAQNIESIQFTFKNGQVRRFGQPEKLLSGLTM